MVLDQVGLECQGLGFAVGDDELDLHHLTHHQSDAWTDRLAIPEIAANAAAQLLGFTDVEDAVLPIPHQVTARFGRQRLEQGFQTLRFLNQRLLDRTHPGNRAHQQPVKPL